MNESDLPFFRLAHTNRSFGTKLLETSSEKQENPLFNNNQVAMIYNLRPRTDTKTANQISVQISGFVSVSNFSSNTAQRGSPDKLRPSHYGKETIFGKGIQICNLSYTPDAKYCFRDHEGRPSAFKKLLVFIASQFRRPFCT